MERVVRKSRTWAGWGKAKSLYYQSEIKHGLEDLGTDIEHCARRFNVCTLLILFPVFDIITFRSLSPK